MTRIVEKGAYKSITFIIDDGNSDISYAGRTCNKHSYTKKVNSALFYLLKRNLPRFILKPRTDLYILIFGGREFQTDDPENAKLVLYRSTRVRGNTYLFDPYRAGALFRRSHTY